MESLPKMVVYHHEFRTALFLSSLTLSTFLFTMKSFIIQTMKSDVYDKDHYQNAIAERNQHGEKKGFYSSLVNFSSFMTLAISMGIFNAFLQITLGYFDSEILVWVCLSSTIISWGIVAWVLYLVSTNMTSMLAIAEDLAVEKYERLTQEESSDNSPKA